MAQDKKNIKGKEREAVFTPPVTAPVPSYDSKEKQQAKIEEMREARKKQIAIIKAQNEMLADARRQVVDRWGEDDDNAKDVLRGIDKAIEENTAEGMSYLNANPSEIEAAQYKEASKYWKDKYQQRLELRNMTDEEMRRKDFATAESNAKTKRGRPKKAKKENMAEETGHEAKEEVVKAEKRTAKPVVASAKYVKQPQTGVRKNSGFDPSSIPDYIQYDVLPLPSRGECYPHKKSTVPVSYITAADENLIWSPNLYRDGNFTDIILKRKILDKDFDVDQMCQGDKDAILIWLRANAYGDEFPVTTTNPANGKEYNTTINLSDFLENFKEFDLTGDENGYFDYTCSDGTRIKWRVVPASETAELRKRLIERMGLRWKVDAYKKAGELKMDVDNIVDQEWDEIKKDIEELMEDLGDVRENTPLTDEQLYSDAITEGMVLMTVSVNGNDDEEYVRNYIENMRAAEARAYRTYVSEHEPGVDLSFTITIPESEGGGSYEKFLDVDDFIFVKIRNNGEGV